MSDINAPVIPGAVMLDRVIGEIQQGLVDNLPWLDAAFGRAQRLTKQIQGNTVITPNVYCGGWNGHGENDYIEVSPDSKIGNFAFFEVDDPQTVGEGPWARKIETGYAIVFWFDLRRVYGEASNRNVEYLKAQVLHFLNGRYGWRLSAGRIGVTNIYDRVENIYRGYSLSEIDNQFLMHPFAGFRVEGTLEFDEECYENIGPVVPVVPIVPGSAVTRAVSRFALWKIGAGRVCRVRGNSVVSDGSLANAMISNLMVLGQNQIDPMNVNITSVEGGYILRSRPFMPVPGVRYKANYNDDFEGQTSNWKILCSEDGQSTTSEIEIERGVAFTIGSNIRLAIVQCDFRFGYYTNSLSVSLSGAQGNNTEYFQKIINVGASTVTGKDESGQVVTLFPDGLKMANEYVRDELYPKVAVVRVGTRDYEEGDEENPEVITDGTRTNYPLEVERVYALTEPLDWSFTAREGGTAFQTPEDVPALLDIVIN